MPGLMIWHGMIRGGIEVAYLIAEQLSMTLQVEVVASEPTTRSQILSMLDIQPILLLVDACLLLDCPV